MAVKKVKVKVLRGFYLDGKAIPATKGDGEKAKPNEIELSVKIAKELVSVNKVELI